MSDDPIEEPSADQGADPARDPEAAGPDRSPGEGSDPDAAGPDGSPAEALPEPGAPLTIAAPSPSPAAAGSVGVSPGAGHRSAFLLLYGLLGAALVAAVVGLVLLVIAPRVGSSAPWSKWQPSGSSTAAIENSIASHVGGLYHLSKNGKPLVAVIAEAPVVTSGTTKVDVSEIAIQQKSGSGGSGSSGSGYAIYPSNNTWMDELCGLGPSCSIAAGQPTNQRGQLVRREALELALYTFKFSGISSLVTYMPPPMGQPAGEVLYFQKSNYGKELSQPLDQTLAAKTPLPTQTDTAEKTTIDKLTLPALYSYSLAALQDGSAALVLNPVLGG
jgi:hypothetical protein